MIDWGKIASQNGLSADEFTKEIMITAACVAAISLDEQPDDSIFRFTCSDGAGPLELIVRRTS